jgi:hypothetical protein
VAFWTTIVVEVVQELTATPEATPTPTLQAPLGPRVLRPEGPNREIGTNTAGRACWAATYEKPGDPHSWIGGIKLDKVQDAATAQRLLENVPGEDWQWRSAEGLGDGAYDFDTGKAIAYHLRFQRGPFTVQVQAGEGRREVVRDLSRQVDGRIVVYVVGQQR